MSKPTDLQTEHDAIGPLGPHPVPAGESVEVGRWPVVIEGKQVAEYADECCQELRRAWRYGGPQTGDEE